MRLCMRRNLCRLLGLCCVLLTASVIMEMADLGTEQFMSDVPMTDNRYDTQNDPYSVTLRAMAQEPVMVVMVTYQRTGSSFLGEIFNQNPDAFEWFEPLDGLYSAMYGTEYGYNVPADIWNYWNGTERMLPEYEIDALATVTSDILTCNLSELPTEILLHHFVEMFSREHKRMLPYVNCANAKYLGKQNTKGRNIRYCRMCNIRLSKVCGQRFGENVSSQLQCAQMLLPHIFPNKNWKYGSTNTLPNTRDKRILAAVAKYHKCMQPCRTRAMLCLPSLTALCQSAPLRALKPVRFPMKAAQRLLEYHPQVKIVYNLRDPRGVVISRHNTSRSFQAVYAGASLTKKLNNSKHDIVKEAQLFCRNALADAKLFQTLKSAQPRSLIQVIYENYALLPTQTAMEVYRFLGLHIPTEVQSWLEDNTKSLKKYRQTTRNSTETSSRWQHIITAEQRRVITDTCHELMHLVGDVWPTN